MKQQIIATVKRSDDFYDMHEKIAELIKNNVFIFRFNLSKVIDAQKFKELRNDIIYMRNKYENIKIMLDIPYPGQKARIVDFCDEQVNINDIIVISSDEKQKKDNCIVVDRLYRCYKKGDILFFADGVGAFEILKEMENNCYEVQAKNTFKLKKRKSISGYNIEMSEIDLKSVIDLEPDMIAFSFVENTDNIDEILRNIGNKKIEVIAKIESQKGVENIEEIVKCYDGIMIARGDLGLNIPMHKLLDTERILSNTAKKNSKKCFIATDIGMSLVNSYMPSRADIVDMLTIRELDVDYIIINVMVAINRNVSNSLKVIRYLAADGVYDEK